MLFTETCCITYIIFRYTYLNILQVVAYKLDITSSVYYYNKLLLMITFASVN